MSVPPTCRTAASGRTCRRSTGKQPHPRPCGAPPGRMTAHRPCRTGHECPGLSSRIVLQDWDCPPGLSSRCLDGCCTGVSWFSPNQPGQVSNSGTVDVPRKHVLLPVITDRSQFVRAFGSPAAGTGERLNPEFLLSFTQTLNFLLPSILSGIYGTNIYICILSNHLLPPLPAALR